MNFEILPGDENAQSDVESGDYELHRKLLPGDVVLDIGAHIGFFTEYASKKVEEGYVMAFEPDQRNFDLLQWRMSRVGLDVDLFHGAVSDHRGIGILWHNPGNSGGHSLNRSPSSTQGSYVELTDIAELVQTYQPTFIKIDAEGSEGVIIRRLLSKYDFPMLKTHIVVEVHTEQLAQELCELFQGHQWKFRPKDGRVGIWYADPL